MDTKKLKLYSTLSLFPLLRKSYALKIMSILLIGMFIPILTLMLYILVSPAFTLKQGAPMIIIILLATLISTVAVFYLLQALLRPITLTATLLHKYISEEQLPKFPFSFEDPVGKLMVDIHYVVEKLDLLTRSLRLNANIDPLTGIQNHRAGEECLRQDLARARRDESQMLVAMVDIDGFKAVNEQFGHHVGDVCLTQIAEILAKSIREGDWIARWGGDVFFIMLWNFNHASPTTVLERIQQQMYKTSMGKLLQISLSIGACQYKGNTELDTETDLETLLIRVEEALAKIKREHRGGIILAVDEA